MMATVVGLRGVDCLNGVVQRNGFIQRGFRNPVWGGGMHMSSSAEFSVSNKGKKRTKSYRLVFEKKGGEVVSPWHDVPLQSSSSGCKSSVFNFVCEIPKYTTAKMEISTKEERNPIAQDIKNGNLRHYCGPLFWNYGCLPQTWENPNIKHPELQVYGDNDPVDVVEIGSNAQTMGIITEVKVLGCLAMIDDGEADFKVIAIDITDPLADELNDIGDVERKCRGVVPGIREWFRWYKTVSWRSVVFVSSHY